MSADKLRRSPGYTHLPPPLFSRITLRRNALKKASPWYMSHAEYQRARRPFPAPVVSKLPLSHRSLSPYTLINLLQHQEKQRILVEYPSHRDRFVTGDRICVTKYISLSDKTKVERVYGFVIARHGGKSLNASFTIRNIKLGEAYEIQYPLYSPFIIRIDLLTKGPHNKRHGQSRAKMYEMRYRDKKEYETFLTDPLPKTAEGRRQYPKGSPEAAKQEKQRKAEREKAAVAQKTQNQIDTKQ